MENLTRVKKPLFTKDMCMICGHQGNRVLYIYEYESGTSNISKCEKCGHLFLFPIPLQKVEDRAMDAIPDAEFFGNSLFKRLQEKFVLQKEIKIVKKLLRTSHPTLLDVGCGTGWTTNIWKNNGFKVKGLELSVPRSKMAREIYKIEVYEEPLETFQSPEKFDLIIMRHVLEHIADPNLVLKKIKNLLKPDGLFIIVIPNINSIGRYIFRENWAWILPWHLHFYTPRTLSALTKKIGFENLRLYQMPSPLWYPLSLKKSLNIDTNAIPNSLSLILFSPIIVSGMLFNLNDNMTLICRNSPEKS